jgi:hypothetical protein
MNTSRRLVESLMTEARRPVPEQPVGDPGAGHPQSKLKADIRPGDEQGAYDELSSIVNGLDEPQFDQVKELVVHSLWTGDSMDSSDILDAVEFAIELGAKHGSNLVKVGCGENITFWFAGTPESVLAQVKQIVVTP